MKSKDAIKFVPVEIDVTAPEITMEESNFTGNDSTPVHVDVSTTAKPASTKIVRAKANSFAKEGHVVPCIAEQGGYWLFQCASKMKTNGTIKGRWLDSIQGSRSFVVINHLAEIDERTVLIKDSKRMVVPVAYFDFAENDNFILSIAGHNCLNDLVKEQNC